MTQPPNGKTRHIIISLVFSWLCRRRQITVPLRDWHRGRKADLIHSIPCDITNFRGLGSPPPRTPFPSFGANPPRRDSFSARCQNVCSIALVLFDRSHSTLRPLLVIISLRDIAAQLQLHA